MENASEITMRKFTFLVLAIFLTGCSDSFNGPHIEIFKWPPPHTTHIVVDDYNLCRQAFMDSQITHHYICFYNDTPYTLTNFVINDKNYQDHNYWISDDEIFYPHSSTLKPRVYYYIPKASIVVRNRDFDESVPLDLNDGMINKMLLPPGAITFLPVPLEYSLHSDRRYLRLFVHSQKGEQFESWVQVYIR
jgi:hypothetical protein